MVHSFSPCGAEEPNAGLTPRLSINPITDDSGLTVFASLGGGSDWTKPGDTQENSTSCMVLEP